MIGSELLRYQDSQRYIVFDIESNGLHLGRSVPWQIAYSICTNKGIESTNVRYILWPDMQMSDEAARVNRFDRETYLRFAEDPEVVLCDFETLLFDPQYLLLGHNLLGFDCYCLNTWRLLCGRKVDWTFMARIVDTLCLSRAYRHMIQPDLSAFTAWQYKMLEMRAKLKKPKVVEGAPPLTPQEAHALAQKGTGCSLGAMAKEFDIEYDERRAHSADYDIAINHAVFTRLLWSLEV